MKWKAVHVISGRCTSWEYKPCEESSEIFDDIENLESYISGEIKMTFVYIW